MAYDLPLSHAFTEPIVYKIHEQLTLQRHVDKVTCYYTSSSFDI